MPLVGMTRAWTVAAAATPNGWEIRGVAKGPRTADPAIAGSDWVAWARPKPGQERANEPPIVEARDDTPERALEALAKAMRDLLWKQPASG
jgi:hypothetical protein